MKFSFIDLDLKKSTWINNEGYCLTYLSKETKRTHRIIMSRILERNLKPFEYVDHINGDKKDNRRRNLRVVNHSQNMMNQQRKEKVKGIRKTKSNNWDARITIQKKCYSLGTYKTKKEAIEAYNKASLKMHGSFGRLSMEIK